jgi:hypothetical protein
MFGEKNETREQFAYPRGLYIGNYAPPVGGGKMSADAICERTLCLEEGK